MPNLSASDLAGERIRQVRQRRGWTVRELASRCTDVGASHITAAVITDLETRRRSSRKITIDELLVLAHVLEVPPVLLFVPLDDAEVLEIAPGVELGALDAAAWVADDDVLLTLTGERHRVPARNEESAIRREAARPLTLIRELRMLDRVIKSRDKEFSESDAERFAGAADGTRKALTAFGVRLRYFSDWLASLGYAPPVFAEAEEILRRWNIDDTSLEREATFHLRTLDLPLNPRAGVRDEGEVSPDGQSS